MYEKLFNCCLEQEIILSEVCRLALGSVHTRVRWVSEILRVGKWGWSV